jgi:hypothetical protein
VDAATIPYVVLHPKALNYARLGDFATVVNLQNGKISEAIVADESSANLPVGEGSIALAQALGIDSNPRTGGKTGTLHMLFILILETADHVNLKKLSSTRSSCSTHGVGSTN